MTCTPESGTCVQCVDVCRRKPGWFRPGEPEKAAALLGISLQELFETKLGVDWWEEDDDIPTTFVVAPAVLNMSPGREYPLSPRGQCVFLNEHDRCSIHEAKPYECAVYWCGTEDPPMMRHRETAQAWVDHQQAVTDLLGAEPMVAEVNGIWDLLDLL